MKSVRMTYCLSLIASVITGCAGTPIDDERGLAVAHMIKSQTYDAKASDTAATVVPVGQDGVAAQGNYNSTVRASEGSDASKRTLKSRVFRSELSK